MNKRTLKRLAKYIWRLEQTVRVQRARENALRARYIAVLAALEQTGSLIKAPGDELTPENLYLKIRENPAITKTDLCDWFGCTYPTLQSRVAALEEAGYIEYSGGQRHFKVLKDFA